ncbi:hypothetical protein GRF29_154g1403324 [Pseudopithomyces chartarum]|uniref:Uncharacterized protein n=1 Tax=Pseudopithomyces chartarum TaxID=1892770 RepID=A0AAN6LSI0_9PLEO|nr:hypothetical protein GRF29_154g1403324 [Pseudopithomyces chartarum]
MDHTPYTVIEAAIQVSDCKVTSENNTELAAEEHRQQGNTVTVTDTNSSPPPPTSSSLYSFEATTMTNPSDTKGLDAPSPEYALPSPPPPPHNHPAEDPAAKKMQAPDSSCVFCSKDISTLSPLDALQHTVKCFYRTTTPTSCTCPICHDQLPHLGDDDLQSSLLHLQKCQQGTKDRYDPIEADDFEALYSSLCGRAKMVERLWRRLNGRLTGSKKKGLSVQKKLDRKRRHVDFVYECEESPLRNSVSGDGEEVEAWRTEGSVGRAARNLFPVVLEEFDLSVYVDFEMF